MTIFALDTVSSEYVFRHKYNKKSVEQDLSEGKHYFYANLDVHQEVIFQANKKKDSLELSVKKVIKADTKSRSDLKVFKVNLNARSSKEDIIEYLRRVSSYKNVYYLTEEDTAEYF